MKKITKQEIQGEPATFKQFAIETLLNYGAAEHMRRERGGKYAYEPRAINPYHLNEANELHRELHNFNMKPDDDLVEAEKKNIEKQIKEAILNSEMTERNKKIEVDRIAKILKEAEDWAPPSSEYIEIYEYMVRLLNNKLEKINNPKYPKMADRYINRLKKALKELNPSAIRQAKINELKKEIEYHTKAYQEEVRLVNESNQWAETFLNSL